MSDQIAPTHEAFNSLVVSCSSSFGKVYETLASVEPANIAAYRERDLFILRTTLSHLPHIKIADENEAGCLCVVGTHMNTYEGAVACFALLAERFPEHAAAPSDCLTDLKKHEASWIAKFGNNPIKREDYAGAGAAATFRPLPPSPPA